MDGSKINDGPASFGAIVQYNTDGHTTMITHSGSLGTHATPYQGEVVAIMLAATEIMDSGNKAQTLIFSDSQAALLALTKVSCDTLMVVACRKMLTHLGQLPSWPVGQLVLTGSGLMWAMTLMNKQIR